MYINININRQLCRTQLTCQFVTLQNTTGCLRRNAYEIFSISTLMQRKPTVVCPWLHATFHIADGPEMRLNNAMGTYC